MVVQSITFATHHTYRITGYMGSGGCECLRAVSAVSLNNTQCLFSHCLLWLYSIRHPPPGIPRTLNVGKAIQVESPRKRNLICKDFSFFRLRHAKEEHRR